MNFAPDLADKILAGEKTVTRRMPSDNPRSPWWRERCAFEVGRDYAICPGRRKSAVGRMRIVDVRLEPLGRVRRDGEVRREGFDDLVGFYERWSGMHGAVDTDRDVWRIAFEVVDRA